jgi:hypothetical protein
VWLGLWLWTGSCDSYDRRTHEAQLAVNCCTDYEDWLAGLYSTQTNTNLQTASLKSRNTARRGVNYGKSPLGVCWRCSPSLA